jgi:hypothetical protein
MSQQEGTPRKRQRASRDEETPEGVDPETGEITEQTPAEAADEDGSTEQVEKAEIARAAYNAEIDAIFGENAPPLECATCNGLGRVWNTEEPQPELVHPPELVACSRCNGYGQVLTGSRNELNQTTTCTACNGTGWKIETPQPENVTPLVPASAATVGTSGAPVMGWMGPDGVFQPLGTPQTGNG